MQESRPYTLYICAFSSFYDKVEFSKNFNNSKTFRHLIYSINLSSNILEEFYCRQSFLLPRCEKSCQQTSAKFHSAHFIVLLVVDDTMLKGRRHFQKGEGPRGHSSGIRALYSFANIR